MVAKKPRPAAAEDSHHSDGDQVYQAIHKLHQVQAELEKVAKFIKEDVWPNSIENLNKAEDEYEYMMILKTTRTRKMTMMVMVAEEMRPEFECPLSSTLRCRITLNFPKYPYPPFCFYLPSSKFHHFLCFMKPVLLEKLVHHCDLCGGSDTSSYNSIKFQHFLCFMKSILSERPAHHCNLCGGSETSSYNSIKFQHFFCFMKFCGGSETSSYNSIKFQHFLCFMRSMQLERLVHHWSPTSLWWSRNIIMQFYQVPTFPLLHEVDAIRKACASLVVQKHHHAILSSFNISFAS